MIQIESGREPTQPILNGLTLKSLDGVDTIEYSRQMKEENCCFLATLF